ncbi:hypothetical protein BV25DRAFT_1000640 [Artomyces pyxidatus]|uniref:Uncharacterized protein n=1 Tax=Artomyces pyxidatus TaxID=48021 RepID=A0ACB8SUB4_9AGAM|nr:hypothetical protein BV25DRAFT_1000640 [Artomyces pyxidatus]
MLRRCRASWIRRLVLPLPLQRASTFHASVASRKVAPSSAAGDRRCGGDLVRLSDCRHRRLAGSEICGRLHFQREYIVEGGSPRIVAPFGKQRCTLLDRSCHILESNIERARCRFSGAR